MLHITVRVSTLFAFSVMIICDHCRPYITLQLPCRSTEWWMVVYIVTYTAIKLGRMRFRHETHNIQIVTYRHSSADRRSIKHAASGVSLWNHFLICFESLRMLNNIEPAEVQIVPAHSYARLRAGGGRGDAPVNPNLTPYAFDDVCLHRTQWTPPRAWSLEPCMDGRIYGSIWLIVQTPSSISTQRDGHWWLWLHFTYTMALFE